MIWPFSVIAELRQDLRHAEMERDSAHRAWDQEAKDLKLAMTKAAADCMALVVERDRLRTEIEALKTPKPKGPYLTCQCGSHRFVTVAHIIGWRKGHDCSEPAPLGATIGCVDCKALWHVDDEGMQRVKPSTPDKGERVKPPVKDDTDLRWGGRK